MTGFPEKRFFCQDQKDQRTELHAAAGEAETEACTLGMAPFTIYELRAHPVGQRVTNKMGAARFKVGAREA